MMEAKTCPFCSKPLIGRGKCKSPTHSSIGPRRIGDIIEKRYFGEYEMVIDIQESVDEWFGWQITVVDIEGPSAGRVRTHSTAWNPKNHDIVWSAS